MISSCACLLLYTRRLGVFREDASDGEIGMVKSIGKKVRG